MGAQVAPTCVGAGLGAGVGAGVGDEVGAGVGPGAPAFTDINNVQLPLIKLQRQALSSLHNMITPGTST